jgi:ribose transport system ATP-binding protein
VSRRKTRSFTNVWFEKLAIKASGQAQSAGSLSGGNQQKVVLAKWLGTNPKLMILDEPTRGIDVGARAEIYRQVAALAADGVAILMVSSDMEEVIGMSDRVVVMRERRVAGVLERAAFSQERIGALMTGAQKAEVSA